MKKHLALTVLAYGYFGFGLGVQQLGIKAGMDYWWVVGIWSTSCIFFFIIIFTSMEKVKDVLFKIDGDRS